MRLPLIPWTLALVASLAQLTSSALAADPDAPREAPGPRHEDHGDRPRNARAADERQDVRRELERARAELRELRAAGQEERAAEMEHRVHELESLQTRSARRTDPPGPGQPGVRRPNAERAERQQRLEHLEIAIRHLREAGLPDLAARVAEQTEPLRRRLEHPGRPEEVRDLRVERAGAMLAELRQALRELNRRVERLEAERR